MIPISTQLPKAYCERLVDIANLPTSLLSKLRMIDEVTDELVRLGICRPRTDGAEVHHGRDVFSARPSGR